MMVEFEVRHTADGLRRIYAEWWSRRYGRPYWISFAITVVAFTWMMVLRAAPWPLVIVATASVAFAAYLRTIRDTVIQRVLKQSEALGDSSLAYTLTEESIAEHSSMGNVELRWTVFDSLVLQSTAALLLRKPKDTNAFIVFPLDQIPPEARRFIDQRLQR